MNILEKEFIHIGTDKITNIKDKVIIEDLQDNYFKYYKYIENKFKDSN